MNHILILANSPTTAEVIGGTIIAVATIAGLCIMMWITTR